MTTDQPGILPDLAALLVAALACRRDSAYYAVRIAARLALGNDASEAEAEVELRKALGAHVPGDDELAAAIRDTPILVENYGYDDSVGAFTATAMLPDELAAVLLDKARDEAVTTAEHYQGVKPLRCVWCEIELAAIDAAPILHARNPDASDEENMQCADQDACRGRQDELDSALRGELAAQGRSPLFMANPDAATAAWEED